MVGVALLIMGKRKSKAIPESEDERDKAKVEIAADPLGKVKAPVPSAADSTEMILVENPLLRLDAAPGGITVVKEGQPHTRDGFTWPKLFNFGSASFLFIFPYLFKCFLSFFAFDKQGKLAADRNISYGSAMFIELIPLPLTLLLVYLIMTPLILAFNIRRSKNRLNPIQFENLAGLTVAKYSPDYYNWEFIVLLRRSLTANMATEGVMRQYSGPFYDISRTIALLGITLVFFLLQIEKQPYKQQVNNTRETMLMALIIWQCVGALLLFFVGGEAIKVPVSIVFFFLPSGVVGIYFLLSIFSISIDKYLPTDEWMKKLQSHGCCKSTNFVWYAGVHVCFCCWVFMAFLVCLQFSLYLLISSVVVLGYFTYLSCTYGECCCCKTERK
jgi:hypothetical protein